MSNTPPHPGHASSALADPTGSPLVAADGDRSPQMRILVVDDLVDAAESLALLLRAIGDYEVRTAYDGPAALAAAQEQRPHAIFLDIALPRLNGYRVAEQIRGNTALQGACLIALTGYGQASDVEEAKQAGFDHHLLKPVDLAQLESVLSHVRSRQT